MAQRSIKFYGMGFVTENDPLTNITAEFDGQVLFQGTVLNHQQDGTPVIEYGEEIFTISRDTILGGTYPVKITVNNGKLVVSGAMYNQTYLEEVITPGNFQTKDGSPVPVEIQQRAQSNTLTDSDVQWINSNKAQLWTNTGDEFTFTDEHSRLGERGDLKTNVKINGVSQSPQQAITGDEDMWHWEVSAGDVLEFDLYVPRGTGDVMPR